MPFGFGGRGTLQFDVKLRILEPDTRRALPLRSVDTTGISSGEPLARLLCFSIAGTAEEVRLKGPAKETSRWIRWLLALDIALWGFAYRRVSRECGDRRVRGRADLRPLRSTQASERSLDIDSVKACSLE
jgi:hypothetical protein